jgi:hypothetical protein
MRGRPPRSWTLSTTLAVAVPASPLRPPTPTLLAPPRHLTSLVLASYPPAFAMKSTSQLPTPRLASALLRDHVRARQCRDVLLLLPSLGVLNSGPFSMPRPGVPRSAATLADDDTSHSRVWFVWSNCISDSGSLKGRICSIIQRTVSVLHNNSPQCAGICLEI